MKNALLLAISLSMLAFPLHADVLTPTTPGAKDAYDLPPARTREAEPPAARAAEEAPPVTPAEVAPQTSPPTVAVPPPAPSRAPAAVAPAAAPKPVADAPAVRAADYSGWFAGAGVGQSRNRDYECAGCGAVTSLDDSGFGYKLFGGYRFNKYVAAIAGYAGLADTKAVTAGGADKLEVDGFFGAVQGIVPVTKAVDVFATLGLFRWDQKVNFAGTAGSFDGTDLMVGVGAGYGLGKPGLKLQVEWNRFQDVGTNDATLGHKDDYDLYTVNLVYQF